MLGHAALDFAIAVAILLALSMLTMMAWAFARGLEIAMRQPGSASAEALQAIGEPGAFAQLSMALLAVGGAAVWAVRRLDPQRAERLALDFLPRESDTAVRTEWTQTI